MSLADPRTTPEEADPGAASPAAGSSLATRVQQLDEQIAAAIRGRLRSLQDELVEHISRSSASLRERLAAVESVLPASFLHHDDVRPLAEEARALGRSGALDDLRESIAALDRAGSQHELLGNLLQQAGRFASRSALFLLHPEHAEGWGSFGFSDSERSVSELTVSLDESAGWQRLAAGRCAVALSASEAAALASRLGSQVPHAAVLIPLVLADRLAAALYADRIEAADPLETPALLTLTYVAAQALELQPLRSRPQTPTLVWNGEAAAGSGGTALGLGLVMTSEEAVAAAPPAAPAVVEEAPAVVEEEPPAVETATLPPDLVAEGRAGVEEPDEAPMPLAVEVEESAWTVEEGPAPQAFGTTEPVSETWDETASELFVHEPAPAWDELPPPPMAGLPAPEAPYFTGDVELPVPEMMAPELPPVATFGTREEPLPLPEWPVAEPEPPEVPPLPMPPGFSYSDVDVTEDATVLLRRPAAPEPVSPLGPLPTGAFPGFPPAPPAVPEPAIAPEDETHPNLGRSVETAAATRLMPRAGGPAEVRPPSGFEGPGLAFAPPGGAGQDTAGHEEARRLARLLVSEIRLYNEEQVEEGRRNRDIYARLRDEIDRSRKMYEERIAADVRASRDYFTDELVRRLADGDPDALGM